jgi:hypothetical protein
MKYITPEICDERSKYKFRHVTYVAVWYFEPIIKLGFVFCSQL